MVNWIWTYQMTNSQNIFYPIVPLFSLYTFYTRKSTKDKETYNKRAHTHTQNNTCRSNTVKLFLQTPYFLLEKPEKPLENFKLKWRLSYAWITLTFWTSLALSTRQFIILRNYYFPKEYKHLFQFYEKNDIFFNVFS